MSDLWHRLYKKYDVGRRGRADGYIYEVIRRFFRIKKYTSVNIFEHGILLAELTSRLVKDHPFAWRPDPYHYGLHIYPGFGQAWIDGRYYSGLDNSQIKGIERLHEQLKKIDSVNAPSTPIARKT